MTRLLDAAAYAVLPPLAGWVFATFLTLRAIGGLRTSEPAFGRILVFLMLPASPVVLGVVGALLAWMDGRDGLVTPLLVLGGTALAATLLQGIMTARNIPGVIQDPARIGKALVASTLPEVIAVGGLLFFILRWS